MTVTVEKADVHELLLRRELFLQENSFEIRYDACDARGFMDRTFCGLTVRWAMAQSRARSVTDGTRCSMGFRVSGFMLMGRVAKQGL